MSALVVTLFIRAAVQVIRPDVAELLVAIRNTKFNEFSLTSVILVGGYVWFAGELMIWHLSIVLVSQLLTRLPEM